ncbi:MAG: MATE family efflux transporter, partial [Firmicutes bacterium]|nr:MATE family efflux transporter [Bacillota bacterium]
MRFLEEAMQMDMTRGPILPRMIRFMIPILIGNIFQQLYNMVDTMIVGKFLGSSALAAVGSTGNLMFMVTGFAMGAAIGFSVRTSQTFGAGQTEQLKNSVACSIILAVALSAALTAVSLAGVNGALHLMRTPADIFAEAKTYITIIFGGITATFFYNLLSAHLRAVGNSTAPLFFLILSAVLNVALDLLLIAGLGMGVEGAAFATVLSQTLSALLCLVYILKRMPILVPGREHWKMRKEVAAYHLKMGVPIGLQHTITASGMVVMQAAINGFGSAAVASITAATKLQYLLMQGCTAMGHTMTTFCGQNTGKGDYRRVREGFKTAVLMELAFSIFAALVLIFVMPKLLFLFFRAGT